MPSKCPQCGEDAVVNDADAPSGSHVCTACGAVTEYCDIQTTTQTVCDGSVFIDAATDKNATMVLYRNSQSSHGPGGVRRIAPSNKLCRNRKEGLNWLKQAALHFKMDKHMTEGAKATYVGLVGKTGRSTLCHKTALAAACCYVAMRQEQWSVSLKEVSDFVQCPLGDVNSAVGFVQKETGAQFTRPSSGDLLSTLLKSYNLDDPDKVAARSKELLAVARTCWLGEGRAPQNVAAAAIFFAWKSLDPRRAKTKYNAFCSNAGIANVRAVCSLVSAFANMLVKLAGKVPWVVNQVNATNVALYVPDILKHTASLVLDCSAPRGTNSRDNSEFRDTDVYESFRMPIARKRPRRESATEEYDSDFSDSEIERHIRTPEEVEAVKKHMVSCGIYVEG